MFALNTGKKCVFQKCFSKNTNHFKRTQLVCTILSNLGTNDFFKAFCEVSFIAEKYDFLQDVANFYSFIIQSNNSKLFVQNFWMQSLQIEKMSENEFPYDDVNL